MSELRDELVERLARLGVEHHPFPGRTDGFAALRYRGKEFAHFHNDRELDLRLTKQTIQREGLVHPPDSTVHPDRSSKSPWIELRFTTVADLDNVMRLVKLAIEQL
jgi:luciferase-like monooxygenase